MTSHCCDGPLVPGLPPQGEQRCGICGHRTSEDGSGEASKPTRELPPSTWLGELAGRRMARKAGRDA